jgi:hypothetical protein
MTPEQIEYAALDVVGTWLVDKEQQKIIDSKDKMLWDTLYNPHVWTALELGGFRLDVDAWRDLAEKNQAIVDEIEEELGAKYGKIVTSKKRILKKNRPASAPNVEAYETIETFVPFNPASPAQVLTILHSRGLNVEKTGDDEIRPYYETDEFVKKILDYRYAAKQASTYGLAFLKYVEEDGRIYTSLNIAKAETGRDCVHGSTILQTSLGDFPISELPLTVLGSGSILTHKGNHKKILRKIYKGQEEMFEVTLDNGSKIKCTKGHRFLTEKGWKHLYELKEDDRLLDPPVSN